jgi:hypothetical protein
LFFPLCNQDFWCFLELRNPSGKNAPRDIIACGRCGHEMGAHRYGYLVLVASLFAVF